MIWQIDESARRASFYVDQVRDMAGVLRLRHELLEGNPEYFIKVTSRVERQSLQQKLRLVVAGNYLPVFIQSNQPCIERIRKLVAAVKLQQNLRAVSLLEDLGLDVGCRNA